MNPAAAATMDIVVARMLREYPLYAAIISAGVMKAESVGTLAVTIRNGRLEFLYDPRFVLAQRLDLLMGGLHHEVMHVLHGHLVADQARFPDREARIVAEETTCNEFIREPLPPDVLRHTQFGLPDDEDTDTRYERLAATNPDRGNVNSRLPRPNSGPRGANSVTRAPISFDDHSVWNEPDVRASGTAVIASVMASAFTQISPREWANLPPSVREKVRSAVDRARSPAPTNSNLIRSTAATLTWPKLLAPAVRDVTERVPTYGRPNRRFPQFVGIIPGSRLDIGRPRVLAVIDSSGSVTDAMLSAISAELTALARHARVTICECDTEIRRTYAYAGPVTTVVGRGGTDLRPPFDPAYLKSIRADVVIVFSDGRGPAPLVAPHMPVIWVVMGCGAVPAKWGSVVRLSVSRDAMHPVFSQ